MLRRTLALVLLALAALAALAVPAGAAEPRASLLDLEDEVMCRVCGVPLNIAEAPQAEDQRELIRELIAQGRTKEQIKDRLVAEYGAAVLATPGDDGFDLAAWLVPVAVVVALLAALALLVPRWRRRPPTRAATLSAASVLSSADARRLEDDLARYDP